MDISTKDKINLLTEQMKQMQNVLTLLQKQQENNLVFHKTFDFIFDYFKNDVYYNILFLRLTLIHLKYKKTIWYDVI